MLSKTILILGAKNSTKSHLFQLIKVSSQTIAFLNSSHSYLNGFSQLFGFDLQLFDLDFDDQSLYFAFFSHLIHLCESKRIDLILVVSNSIRNDFVVDDFLSIFGSRALESTLFVFDLPGNEADTKRFEAMIRKKMQQQMDFIVLTMNAEANRRGAKLMRALRERLSIQRSVVSLSDCYIYCNFGERFALKKWLDSNVATQRVKKMHKLNEIIKKSQTISESESSSQRSAEMRSSEIKGSESNTDESTDHSESTDLENHESYSNRKSSENSAADSQEVKRRNNQKKENPFQKIFKLFKKKEKK